MPEKRILLVEDERDLREVLALGLRRAGYTVDVAVTAAAPGVPHGSGR
jgi:DNA-binding response OmpR family regulator